MPSSVAPLSGWGPYKVWEHSNGGGIWWTEDPSLAYPRSRSSSEEMLAVPSPAFPMTHAFLVPGRSSLGALLSSLEQMWTGKVRKKEKRLGGREVI